MARGEDTLTGTAESRSLQQRELSFSARGRKSEAERRQKLIRGGAERTLCEDLSQLPQLPSDCWVFVMAQLDSVARLLLFFGNFTGGDILLHPGL